MIGLPNETKEDLKNTIDFINNHDIQGVKIHSTYIIKNTKLAEIILYWYGPNGDILNKKHIFIQRVISVFGKCNNLDFEPDFSITYL